MLPLDRLAGENFRHSSYDDHRVGAGVLSPVMTFFLKYRYLSPMACVFSRYSFVASILKKMYVFNSMCFSSSKFRERIKIDSPKDSPFYVPCPCPPVYVRSIYT